MEQSILSLVVQTLRSAGFAADCAYPGCMTAPPAKSVAAVHIHKVDRAALTVTVDVRIVSPAAHGGTACELDALRATEVLNTMGASCVQNGCQYDSIARIYSVSILASFNCVTQADSCILGPGFSVKIQGIAIEFASMFSAEKCVDTQCFHEMGENEIAAIRRGEWTWKLILEERIPPGFVEPIQNVENFTLQLQKQNGMVEFYQGCYWTSEKKSYTREGIYRVRVGFAKTMEGVM